MKKQVRCFVILMILLIMAFCFAENSFAADIIKSGNCGTNVTYTLNSDGLLKIEGSGEMTNFSYSNSTDETKIPWVEYRTTIKTVEIDDGITSIGTAAFYGCTLMSSVKIPDSVTSIGDLTFYWCSSLMRVEIPNSVTSIGKWAFDGCSSLTDVVIGENVTSIGDYAFYKCSSLTSVEIPNSVTSIGDKAFYGCSSLTSVEISNSVTSIGNSAFSGCSSLTSVVIPDSVTSIGSYAFEGCSQLETATVNISSFETWMRNAYEYHTIYGPLENATAVHLMQNGEEITELVIPEGVTSIGSRAFEDCSSLTSVEIPDSVTSIESHAFRDCRSLTRVVIGDSVASIGYQTFYKCDNLKTAYVNISSLETWMQNASSCHTSYGPLYYPANVHLMQNGEEITELVIPEGVTSIGEYVFSGCSSLTSVEIPDSVTSIGYCAFRDCSSLPRVVIGDSVTSIGGRAFEDCSSLTRVVIGDSVTSIGGRAFSGCSSLTSIVIGDRVTSIELYAFPLSKLKTVYVNIRSLDTWMQNASEYHTYDGPLYYATTVHLMQNGEEITELVIPEGVTSIVDEAFSGCSNLTSVEIPDSVTSIGYCAFRDCSSLTRVVIGDSVTSIEWKAFSGCSSLTSVVIGDGVTSINNSAFEGCSQLETATVNISSFETWMRNAYEYHTFSGPLENATAVHLMQNGEEITELVIPEGVTSIGDMAFRGCSNLTSVEIPESVTRIGSWAFEDCRSLTRVVIGDGVTSIGSGAFEDCSSLTSVEIPDSVTSIGSGAFEDCRSLTRVVIGDSVTSIGREAFSGCSSLTSIVMGDRITRIEDYAFECCSKLMTATIRISSLETWIQNASEYYGNNGPLENATTVHLIQNGEEITELVIPNSVTCIGSYAFYGCSSLTSVVIPDSVTHIGTYGFYGCRNLTSIIIPKNVTSIGYNAFKNTADNFVVTLADGITSIGSWFRELTNLKECFIPNTVENIDSFAFFGCTNLSELVIPDSVTTIWESAFSDCSKLDTIEIGDKVSNWGPNVFEGCGEISLIKINIASIEDWCSNCADYYRGSSNLNYGPFYYAKEIQYYIDGEELVDVVIPDGITSIGDYAFYKCDTIKTITIPDTVKTLGNCMDLTDTTIKCTFRGSACSWHSLSENLSYYDVYTSVPHNLTLVTEAGLTWQQCSECGFTDGLKYIVEDDIAVVKNWDDKANKKKVVIPAKIGNYTVVRIGDETFYNERGSSVLDVEMPSTVTEIGYRTFSDCRKLSSIVIPDSVTKIGNYAFDGCCGLTELVISDGVTNIGDGAFRNCSSLTSVEISNSVTSIGKSVFYNCSSLMNMVIPDSVREIDSSAFKNCSNLANVIIGCNVKSIYSNAFENTALTELEIPASVTYIDNNAFGMRYSEVYQQYRPIKGFIAMVTQGGAAENYCKDNGIKYISNHVHNYVTLDSVPATCKAPGLSVGKACSICGNVQQVQEEIPALGHTLTYHEALAPTDRKPGRAEYWTCDRCGLVFADAEGAQETTLSALVIPSIGPSDYEIPQGTDAIEAGAFAENEKITSVVIPNSVNTIGDSAFKDCINLENVEIPSGVSAIGRGAFDGCESLTEIVIPYSVTEIGDHAFGMKYDSETGNYVAKDGFTAHVIEGSAAETYCKENGIAYISTHEHSSIEVEENVIEATCTEDGHFDFVVYCDTCKEELSRETRKIEKKSHSPADPVKENEIPASFKTPGTYDLVVYCKDCGAEISRVEKSTSYPHQVLGVKGKIKLVTGLVPATCQKILWTTSDKTKATVSSGTVTGKAVGNVTITAELINSKTKEVLDTETFELEIVPALSGIKLSAAKAAVGEGYDFPEIEVKLTDKTGGIAEYDLYADYAGSDFEIEWTGETTFVVHGNHATSKAVSVSIIDKVSGKKAKLSVTVGKPANAVTTTMKGGTQQGVVLGKSLTLKAVGARKDGIKPISTAVVWESSDETIARIDAKGKLTPVSCGTCQITAHASGGEGELTFTVTVWPALKSFALMENGAKVTKKTASIGDVIDISEFVTEASCVWGNGIEPADYDDLQITYTTSAKPAIAELSADGMLTCNGKGTAKVTVTVLAGNQKKTASISIVVE